SSLAQNDYFNEELSYDLNGNIKTLKRFSWPAAGGTTAEKIDDLIYNYQNGDKSNVLDKITLLPGVLNNSSGYNALQGTMVYNLNGNMTDHPDRKMKIIYNYLNLPNNIAVNAGIMDSSNTSYIYRADGTKVSKVYDHNGPIETNYLDGFQYDNRHAYDTAASLYTIPVLKFVPTSEGYYDFTENKYIYNYTDHLGNVRVSYRSNGSGIAEVIDANNYYPFGLKHQDGLIVPAPFGGVPYNYKYNGKELQETGMYDYGARFYMPDLGRWGVVDPLAEKMTRHSPYNYAFNNPIRFIDPDGRQAMKPTPKEAAAMAAHVYGDKKDNILIGGWRVSQTKFEGVQLEDEASGFKSQIYERVVNGKVTEYTYATAGTEDLVKDGVADVAQPVGASSQYSLSAKNATALSNQLGDTELTYTGHSLGGGLAALNSNLTRREAVTFNAAGIGAATKYLNGMNNSDMKGWFGGLTATFRTEGLINAYIMKTDPLNIAQDKSLLMPDVNGKRHTVWPTSASSVYNGHSMDNMLKEFGINPIKYAK
ncbi:RHS repeat-associated core domain-containing protein, partial [Chryseobacterium sediminis]|uniref:RHS repeat-associated core domain-containing protein n=1 Tax=Chryseobacterium sediminis TaxID=1679494 RepID=UPI002855C278